jgi:Ca-activated chloride channel family protein
MMAGTDGQVAFAYPHVLWLLACVPLVLLLRGRPGTDSVVVFPGAFFLAGLFDSEKRRAGPLGRYLLAGSLACAVVALARPQRLRSHETVKASGIEIILAVDVSMSMRIEDFTIGGRRVNRLAAAKKVTREFVSGRDSDRIGVVAFAGRPYVPSPLTLDHDWVLESLERLEMGQVEDGTAIGSAIAAAARRLDQREAKSKIIVLLTDGANNSGDLTPEVAADLARTLGIRIYTIAVGTTGRHPIPLPGGGRTMTIRQEFDEETLRNIAEISEGVFYHAEDTSSLEEIFSRIDSMEKTELIRRKVVEIKELFPWAVAAALTLALLHIAFYETALRSR